MKTPIAVQLKVTCPDGIKFAGRTIPPGTVLGGGELVRDEHTQSTYYIAYFDGQPIGVQPDQVEAL